MAGLLEFDPSYRCPKCGTRLMEVRWIAAAGDQIARPTPVCHRTPPHDQEHLHLTCGHCGFHDMAMETVTAARARGAEPVVA